MLTAEDIKLIGEVWFFTAVGGWAIAFAVFINSRSAGARVLQDEVAVEEDEQ